MALATLVSVEEYLSTPYHPDCEYVDGEVIERNVGEFDHSGIQLIISTLLFNQASKQGAFVFPELRMQTGPRRFRVPDILVTTRKGRGRILKEPPFLCVEILSPEDRFSRVEAKINEYLDFGIPNVWVVDPRQRKAWPYSIEGRKEADKSLATSAPDLVLNLPEIFAALDSYVDGE